MSQIIINGTAHPLHETRPERSLLSYLRETLALTGTKEGCASGDCGACTVMVHAETGADLDVDQRYFAVNACIAPLGAFAGRSIVTVEGLGTPAQPHPVQQAMVDEHGSQCGFCTPGFVMVIAAQQLDRSPFPAQHEHEAATQSIGGNLCRCTGYRPILSAMKQADAEIENRFGGDPEAALPVAKDKPGPARTAGPLYHLPQSLADLRGALAATGKTARLVAGGTDLWLEATQRYQQFPAIIDLSQVPELNELKRDAGRLHIGAAVSHRRLARLFSGKHELGADLYCPAALHLLERFGSPQVRNRGTIGGNIGNASPIADWPPFLLCLDAELVLGSATGERRVAIVDYYLDYRRTVLEDGEFLLRIEVPEPASWQTLYAHKISKRTEDDISSVFGAFHLLMEEGQLTHCRIAYGGMAATPMRLNALEDALVGQPVTDALRQFAQEQIAETLAPLSDVRASASYRLAMAQTLMDRALRQVAGDTTDEPEGLAALEAIAL